MGLGGFPDIGLSAAREAARAAHEAIKAGKDPIAETARRRGELAASRAQEVTFKTCALKYIESHEKGWTRKSHFQWSTTLENHVYPRIGAVYVRDIGVEQVLEVLRPIWNDKNETASRIRGRIEKILDAARVAGLRNGENPARWRGNLDVMLPAPNKVQEKKHFTALPYPQVAAFMKRLRQAEGQAARALEFAIMTALRPGPVRHAMWTDFDLTQGIWNIPAQAMKGKMDHRVPLSSAALELLEKQARVQGNNLVFPSPTGKVLSDAAMNQVLARMEVPATAHGFRSAFRDWVAEETDYPSEVAEMALAHKIPNKVEAAYRRGDLFAKRKQLMEEWADYCAGTAPASRSR